MDSPKVGDEVECTVDNYTFIRKHETAIVIGVDGGVLNLQFEDGGDNFYDSINFKLKEENKMLERNEEYDVKLTGEEIAWLYNINYYLENADSRVRPVGMYDKLKNVLKFNLQNCELGSHLSTKCVVLDARSYLNWTDKLFTPPKSQQQIEYEALQKSISEHEESLKKLKEQANKLKPE